jgi:AcrR family transcriptional regulator
MPAVERKYHHGNLRQALIDEGMSRLQAGGHVDLSLRELARSCGVSANAPYRHFKTKESLVSALIEIGFEMLSLKLAEARIEGPVKQFRDLAEQFSQFGRDHPSLFRLMFGVIGTEDPSSHEGHSARQQCFLQVAESVRIVMGEVLVDAEVRQNTLVAWSLLYGYSLLAIEGTYPLVEATDDFAARDVARVLARGLKG